MTHSREHLTTWIGLAVGLGLAWAGWEWWRREVQFLADTDNMIHFVNEMNAASRSRTPVPLSADWKLEWWANYAAIASLALVAVLCAVAGALIGRRQPTTQS